MLGVLTPVSDSARGAEAEAPFGVTAPEVFLEAALLPPPAMPLRSKLRRPWMRLSRGLLPSSCCWPSTLTSSSQMIKRCLDDRSSDSKS